MLLSCGWIIWPTYGYTKSNYLYLVSAYAQGYREVYGLRNLFYGNFAYAEHVMVRNGRDLHYTRMLESTGM